MGSLEVGGWSQFHCGVLKTDCASSVTVVGAEKIRLGWGTDRQDTLGSFKRTEHVMTDKSPDSKYVEFAVGSCPRWWQIMLHNTSGSDKTQDR